METHEPPAASARDGAAGASLPGPGGARSASRSASSSAPGSSPGTSRSCPSPGSYLTTRGRRPARARGARRRGELRAFRNVCRHRGSRLLSGTGKCSKAIRCRYHGWTYRLDGELIGMPEARSIRGSTSRALGLFPARGEVLLRARVREPRHPRHAAGRAGGGLPSASRPTASSGWSRAPSVAASRPTGRSSSTTTSRATTCRSPTRGSCGCSTTRTTTSRCTTTRSGSTRRCATSRRATGSSAPTSASCADARPRRGATGASGATSSSGRTPRSTSTPTRS